MSIFIWSSKPSKVYVWSSEVSAVYVWTTKVRPSGWKPWSNTIAYYPLNWDANDYSGNWHNGTTTNVTYTTLSSWKQVASYTQNNSRLKILAIWWAYQKITTSIWLKWDWTLSNYVSRIWCLDWNNNWRTLFQPRRTKTNDWGNLALSTYNWSTENNKSLWVSPSNWTNLVVVFDSWTLYWYVNWIYKGQLSSWFTSWTMSLSYNCWIGSEPDNSQNWWGWYMSEAIIENKTRTAQDIQDYYNLTKSNYWL